jgi:hypothetical protein
MEDLRKLAALLHERDEIEARIAGLTGRSARQGDVGEFIAARVFDIALAPNAVQAGYDGHFRSGELAGRTVNVKTYGSATAGIDISAHECDYYLVLSGPSKPVGAGPHYRWQLSAVYLFDAKALIAEFNNRKVKIGIATSLRVSDLAAAQIYPAEGPHSMLTLTDDQRLMLSLFCDTSPAVSNTGVTTGAA